MKHTKRGSAIEMATRSLDADTAAWFALVSHKLAAGKRCIQTTGEKAR